MTTATIRTIHRCCPGGFALAAVWACAAAAAGEDAAPRFEENVRPILQMRCVRCHGRDKQEAELNLATASGLAKGGESGAALDRDAPGESLMLQRIEAGEMPPEGEPPLAAVEIEIIRRWIESGATLEVDAAPTELSHDEILPILLLRCAACHGRQKQEGGLDIRSKQSLLAGGKSGPAIVPGKADESLLIKKIAAGEMPPKVQLAAASVKPVESAELQKLSEWIAQGAPEAEQPDDLAPGEPDPLVSDEDRQFWAFQPPRFHAPPRVSVPVNNPIDAFILQRLEEQGLALSPTADRLILLRRVSFDLLGLPPDPHTAQRFLDDPDPLAYEKLIDELLASSHYGERWGQFWLDLAGYSDSEGVQDSDLVRPFAWRYRDYVIRAFNDDKPYDRFLLEQIAGDELADYENAPEITPEIYDNLVATGFLRMTPDGTFAGINGFVPNRLDIIDDSLRVLGSSVLGLTIGCARCHSHKFDPIPQRDYYRLAAVFKGALDEHDWLKPTRQPGPPGTHDRYLPYVTAGERSAWEAQEKEIQSRLDSLKVRLEDAQEDPEQKKNLEEQMKAVEAQRRPEPLIRALWDRGEPSPTYLLRRGDYLSPTRIVEPGLLSVLTDDRTPLSAEPPWPGAKKTGLRLAFARWLTRPDHPLTARVMVNRVWKHHFGEGLVRTIDDFGRAGEAPSHPELLDWLAVQFIRDAWSLKTLHRRILTSATYRQASLVMPRRLELDPENRTWSRAAVRRLDAESLRDTLLSLGGRLDTRPFGPPDAVTARPDGLITAESAEGYSRRSVYILHRRSQPLTLLADFDRPAMSPNCTRRMESTVATQALHLMNSAMSHDLAAAFADRVITKAGDDPGRQIDLVYWLAYSRPPTHEEREMTLASLDQLRGVWRERLTQNGDTAADRNAARKALGNVCHAVMNSAELLFVD
jgi:cytochrome c553